MSAENIEKKKALEAALGQIEKQFGKGSVMKLGDYTAMSVEAIPTGALSLDVALGIGGIPRGRIIEVYGPESSGKTTLTLHMIAEAQKMGGEAAFIDAEHALDPVYAKHLGVDIDNLIVAQPDTGEQALEIAEALVRSGALDIIVVDSVAALVPKAEIDGDMGDSHIGLQARLMSQALRKLAGAINKSKCVIVFINQLREKVGVMFGNPETTTGGRALKYYASVRLDIRKIENLKQDGEVVGNRARVKVVKNKVAPPFREAEFDIMYGKGISKEGNIVDLAVNLDIIEKSGSWFSYDGTRIGQGRENVKKFLIENPDIMKEVENKIRDNFSQAFEKSLGDEESNDENDSEDEEFDRQKTKVLKYIIFKKRTEYEVRQKFRNIIEDNLLEDIIQELKENLYINDDDYIERAVNEFMAINTLSIKQIKYKLYSKGLKSDLIENYIEKHEDELQEYEKKNAEKIVQKKINTIEEEKLRSFLKSKGYKEDNIKSALYGGE